MGSIQKTCSLFLIFLLYHQSNLLFFLLIIDVIISFLSFGLVLIQETSISPYRANDKLLGIGVADIIKV